MTDLPTYEFERLFDAPRDLVWRAFTDPDLLARWYGPGVETVIHGFDLEPGGAWLNEMKWGENSNYQKMEFIEVSPPERLVWRHCSADADWNVAASPMMPDWPRILHTTVTFEEVGDRTSVRLTQVPEGATEAEIACFTQTMSNMDGGWGKGYEVVDQILEELRSA
jgi:uncharacterized protein YndB with AHSA1/START domain